MTISPETDASASAPSATMTGDSELARLLAARYGDAAPPVNEAMNDVIALQLRHRSVRQFTEAHVSDDAVTAIIAAAQSASTSSNMQSWSVIELRDPARKDAARALSGGQAFITQAPVFLVFVADLARNRAVAGRHAAATAATDYLESTLIGFVDAALAAQNAAIAAESMGLGVTYVGSARNNPIELSALLGLPEGVFPVTGLAIGHPDPRETADIKPRLSQEIVRHRETYRAAEDGEIDAYDDAIFAYYATQGEGRAWTPTMLASVRDASSLRGRDVIREALERRGLPSV